MGPGALKWSFQDITSTNKTGAKGLSQEREELGANLEGEECGWAHYEKHQLFHYSGGEKMNKVKTRQTSSLSL